MTYEKPNQVMRGKARALRKNMTDEEKSLWYELREFKARGHYFRKQGIRNNIRVIFVSAGGAIFGARHDDVGPL